MSAFDAVWSESVVAIESAAEERATVAAAQAGDESATLTLLRAYMPTLRSVVRRHWGMLGELDELRSVAVLGFMEAVAAWDADGTHDRLGDSVRFSAERAINAAAAENEGAAQIPVRTLERFWTILRHAEGDAARGAELAPRYAMDPDTFRAVYRAVTPDSDGVSGDNSDVTADASLWLNGGSGEFADIEDRMLVDIAFGAVTSFESDVCRLHYGFTDYEPVPDGEIAARLGFSRLKILRARTAALAKMRQAIGAGE